MIVRLNPAILIILITMALKTVLKRIQDFKIIFGEKCKLAKNLAYKTRACRSAVAALVGISVGDPIGQVTQILFTP